MRGIARLSFAGSIVLSMAAITPAAASTPEIQRPAAKPQAVGLLHTVRTIPEACVRIEGKFTGQAAPPYAIKLVKTHPQCQPRARWVDTKQAPSSTQGWVLNDLIRIPSAGCPGQQALVHVWRRPGVVTPPALDGQGRARVYLEDAMKDAPASASRTAFTMTVTTEGASCPRE